MNHYWKPVVAFTLLVLIASASWADRKIVPVDELKPIFEHQLSTHHIVKVISNHHYKDSELNDEVSQQILERYLETLDPNRFFFLASDINDFARYETSLDDYLKNAKVEPAFDIFRTYRTRVSEAVAHAIKLLDGEFDFTLDETYRFDREDAPWVRTEAERSEIWRKRVKNDFLNLRMTGKADDEIRKTLRSRYERLESRVAQYDPNDVYQAFINAYTLNLEPHTSYMSPSTSENFDISMRLSLEGIGAVLRSEDDYTVVQKTVVGGPAKLSGQLHAGDRIVGVGQGMDGEIEDIIGWRLQDVVEKIRGPKGSLVRLLVLPKGRDSGGKRELIKLVRNTIKLEEQAAKSSIIENIEGLGKSRIGVIEVPTFYRDFAAESRGEKDFRSTTRDVRDLLTELKNQEVDGIIIDLRQNGGGSLSEATELTGLFIDSGPVVQVKHANGRVEVEKDTDKAVAYAGPLAVLVDRNSASASEIFAGAIQDYRRGIILGEPTFGKGTVQTLVDLSRYVPGKSMDLGRLRLTMAQFFRVNGGSTQHRGVVPDIQFPTAEFTSEYGERSLDNALPFAKIRPASYRPNGSTKYADLTMKHRQRIDDDPGFHMLVEQEKRFTEIDERTEVTLLESKRKAEWDARENKLLEQKNRFRISQGLKPLSGDDTEDQDESDTEAESDARKSIQLNESARILVDSIRMRALMAEVR
ncbi:MAG: carboxy terminal-processing peptidase [Gammaproteobacteria bacterium]|nr:carboxy terminal-processing peptidase [Gammaproteobacteria bacterium]